MQEHSEYGGFTDFEIEIDNELYIIVEAKRGWKLPEQGQLRKYRKRFSEHRYCKRLFLTLSECTQSYAQQELAKQIRGVPLRHLSWLEILKTLRAERPFARGAEKKVLDQFRTYLGKVIAMQNNPTNMAYCVSLAKSGPTFWNLKPLEIVDEKHRYFFPVGKGWPETPPKYIAFRYNGKLHGIYHVERYEVVTELHQAIKEIAKKKHQPYYVLTLGPKFEPRKEVRVGKIWSNGRLWIELDLLFTSNTVKEASELTKKRQKKYD
jgi:hypothetical protein